MSCRTAVSRLLDHVRQNKHERYAVSDGVTSLCCWSWSLCKYGPTVLAGLNLRMLSASKNAQQQQETSLHLQGVFGRFCAHLCQMRHASYMLWDKLCHTSYATQHGRITDSIGQLVSFQGEMYLSRFGCTAAETAREEQTLTCLLRCWSM